MIIVRKGLPVSPDGLIKIPRTLGFKSINGNYLNVDVYKGHIEQDPMTTGDTAYGNSLFAITQAGSGSGVTTLSQGDSNHVQGLTISTGTSGSGRTAIRRAITTISNMGAAKVFTEWEIKYSALSDGTNTYESVIGLHDTLSGDTYAVDGAWFWYSPNYGSTWWTATTSNGPLTLVNTGVTVTTNWLTLRVETNYLGTEVYFFIDGVLVSTHTTNIFNGATQLCSPFAGIYKWGGSTARNISLTNVLWGAIYQNSQV